MAIIMMLAGTVGIIIGGPIALAVFGQWLPPDAWKGFAALSGSWISGTANLVAMPSPGRRSRTRRDACCP